MKEEQPKLILICFPFQEQEHKTKGKPGQCIDCDATVWVSDSSLKNLEYNFPEVDFKKDLVEIVCLDCAVIRHNKGNLKIVPPTPEQWIDIKRELREVNNKNNPNVN